MNHLLHIRKAVFGLKQAEFASIAGVSQATVSRWERGEWEPTREQMSRIRQEAISRGLAWNDTLFFVHPEGSEAVSDPAESPSPFTAEPAQ